MLSSGSVQHPLPTKSGTKGIPLIISRKTPSLRQVGNQVHSNRGFRGYILWTLLVNGRNKVRRRHSFPDQPSPYIGNDSCSNGVHSLLNNGKTRNFLHELLLKKLRSQKKHRISISSRNIWNNISLGYYRYGRLVYKTLN